MRLIEGHRVVHLARNLLPTIQLHAVAPPPVRIPSDDPANLPVEFWRAAQPLQSAPPARRRGRRTLCWVRPRGRRSCHLLCKSGYVFALQRGTNQLHCNATAIKQYLPRLLTLVHLHLTLESDRNLHLARCARRNAVCELVQLSRIDSTARKRPGMAVGLSVWAGKRSEWGRAGNQLGCVAGVAGIGNAARMRLSPVRNVLKVTVRVEDRDNLIPALLRRPLAWRLLGCVG